MAKLGEILAGAVITAILAVTGLIIIPKLLNKQPGDDEDLPNPVTETNFSINPNRFVDGSSVGFFWNIQGGSGRFRATLWPGEGTKISITESEFSAGQIFHVFNVGNIETQNRSAIFQIVDIDTGIAYNEDFDYIIDPKDEIPNEDIFPVTITLAQPLEVTQNNELIVKVNYKNTSNKVTQAIDAYLQVRNSNLVVKYLASTNIGNLQPGQTFTLSIRTTRLATFSVGFEWRAEFFAWKANSQVILANKLTEGFTLPVENNP